MEQLAQGGADPCRFFGIGITLEVQTLLELLGHQGDQGVDRPGGELLQLRGLRGLLAFALDPQPQQPLLQVMENLLIGAMTRQAEAAAHLQPQQVAGDPARRELLKLALEMVKVAIATKADPEVVPSDPVGGYRMNLRKPTALQLTSHLD